MESSSDVTKPESPKGTGPVTAGRIALIAALIIALVAIGWQLSNDQRKANSSTPQNAEGSPAPASVDEMIAGLESKLQEDPDNADGWRMLGWSYFETGRFAESATAMRRAIQLDPAKAEYHSMLGEALVMAAQGPTIDADARAAFAQALKLDPKDPRARYFLAAAKDIDGKHREAIEDWFALLADTPADAPYAEDIRTVIRNVGKERGIAVEDRLAQAKFAPPSQPVGSDGAAVATAAIPGPSREQMQAAASLPPGQQEAMIRSMVDGLAARLAKQPDDANGWIMLMRSRMQLGETQKAAQAYRDARTALGKDRAALARLDDAATALGVPAS